MKRATHCQPFYVELQCLSALQFIFCLLHEQQLGFEAPAETFKSFLADEDPTTGDNPDCCPMPPLSSALVLCSGGFR